MWVDDYFHYEDWQKRQEEVYDSFNLLQVPSDKAESKYFYDNKQGQRIVPKGIFPPANGKRQVIMPQVPRQLGSSTADVIQKFEKDPYAMMVN